MTGVLVMACAGPMQSWGTRSRFQERDTEREPSKSGIIGLLCAALGRDRNEPVADLAALRMGIRVDREGKLSKDFQTAQDVIVASGKGFGDLVSNRYYLSDAVFLVGLEGKFQLLKELHEALRKPMWQIFLGRKSYIPSHPVYLADGLFEKGGLREVLLGYRLLVEPEEVALRIRLSEEKRADGRLRLVLESLEPTHETRCDHPLSFAIGKRFFRERYVATEYVPLSSFV